jgi:hypothetical protein
MTGKCLLKQRTNQQRLTICSLFHSYSVSQTNVFRTFFFVVALVFDFHTQLLFKYLYTLFSLYIQNVYFFFVCMRERSKIVKREKHSTSM